MEKKENGQKKRKKKRKGKEKKGKKERRTLTRPLFCIHTPAHKYTHTHVYTFCPYPSSPPLSLLKRRTPPLLLPSSVFTGCSSLPSPSWVDDAVLHTKSHTLRSPNLLVRYKDGNDHPVQGKERKKKKEGRKGKGRGKNQNKQDKANKASKIKTE
jgi:hypothetical protein